ncbi:MAG: hypothetical protein P8X57_15070 [Cyclobacteriaceae bacterium]
MKTSTNNQNTMIKGAGYLIGSGIVIMTAIIEFIISENIVISISSIPIGITMGIILEQRFQGKEKPVNFRLNPLLFIILLLGLFAFVSIFLLW